MSVSVTDVIRAAGDAERKGDVPQAVHLLQDAIAETDQQGDLFNALGGLFGRQGRFSDAEQAFAQALTANPSLTIARFNLGSVFIARGEYEAAAFHFEEVLQMQPGHAGSLLSLGSVCNATGKYRQAIPYYREFLDQKPSYAPGWVYLGASYQFLSEFDRARECYQRALALDPDLADANCNLGKLYQSEGDHRAAERHLRRTLEIAPDHAIALAGLATLLERAGDYEAGLGLLEPVLHSKSSAEIAVAYASICRRVKQPQKAEPVLQSALQLPGLPLDGRVQVHFSLGHVHDANGDYEEAFESFSNGNTLKPVSYDCEALVSSIDTLIDTFDEGFIDRLQGSAIDNESPVFLIGMPRVGKSLLEQMLSVHPDVVALGELTDIGDLSTDIESKSGLAYPANLIEQDRELMSSYAMRYLGKMTDGALRCTDTLPGNFVHLGLIELLFPEARVIHLRRDVLDTCLSCYFKNFAGMSLAYTFDLHNIGIYYREYAKMMRHWRSVSGLRILDVEYESLVTDTAGSLAVILEFLGLDDCPGCLDFHTHDAGTVQRVAHEPTHDRYIGMHRNYQQHLAPLVDALGPSL